MMKLHQLVIILFLSISTAACVNTAPKQNNGVKLVAPKNTDVNELLIFAEQYSDLTPEAQKQVITTTNQSLSVNPNDLLQRMKLAIIYGLPSSNHQDTAKAQNLLQQMLQENNLTKPQLAFAHLLFDYVIAINKANKNSREDQKQMETVLQKNENLLLKLEASQQKLEITQQKLEAAQLKIDELKNIEKSMGQREVTPRK